MVWAMKNQTQTAWADSIRGEGLLRMGGEERRGEEGGREGGGYE